MHNLPVMAAGIVVAVGVVGCSSGGSSVDGGVRNDGSSSASRSSVSSSSQGKATSSGGTSKRTTPDAAKPADASQRAPDAGGCSGCTADQVCRGGRCVSALCDGAGANCTSQLASAVRLDCKYNCESSELSGFCQTGNCPGEYALAAGATIWFLVDPKGFGMDGNIAALGKLEMDVVDFSQGTHCGDGTWPIAQLAIVDSSDAVINFDTLGDDKGWYSYTDSNYAGDKRYLLKVTGTDCEVPESVWWTPSAPAVFDAGDCSCVSTSC